MRSLRQFRRKKVSGNSLKSKRKGQDLIQHLPSQVMVDIFSRLPILTIMRCKCVCKSWLELIKSDEFFYCHTHLSKTIPAGLAVFEEENVRSPSSPKQFVELVDLTYRWKIELNVFSAVSLHLDSCAGSLLFFYNEESYPAIDHHMICNPVTREYLMLPSPPRPSSRPDIKLVGEYYGFGVSRSGQYKVVCILVEKTSPDQVFQCQCHVYTVGSGGEWRRIAFPSFHEYADWTMGTFLEGNLHCVDYDDRCPCQGIHCIDLETEVFSAFSAPPNLDDAFRSLSVLWDCLCVCDNLVHRHEIDIWLMKEYGDEKSWTKELCIRKPSLDRFRALVLRPVKVFENGDILIQDHELLGGELLYYSSETATFREEDVLGLGSSVYYKRAKIYTPTFLSLKTTFPMENVFSF